MLTNPLEHLRAGRTSGWPLRQNLTERPDIFNLYELMGEVEGAIRASVEARIRLVDSEGKGS